MKSKCPKDSDLVRLSVNETDPKETDRLFRHLASCSRCSLRFEVLRQVKKDLLPKFEAFTSGFEGAASGPILSSVARTKLQALEKTARRTPRHGSGEAGLHLRLRLVAGFLTVLVVVASGIYFAGVRTASRSDTRSLSLRLRLIEPTGTIGSIPIVFRWSPVLNAENYVFELSDDSLERVHGSSIFLINELVLPADVRLKLVRGRTYLWSIWARDGDSDLLASESGSFVIE